MPARDILRISIFITILLGANVYSQVIAPAITPLPTGETTGVVETLPPLDTDISRTRDVVLVLDNSTGIKSTDPQFLARQALTGLVVQMDGRTHLGIIVFDQDVKPVVGMVSASFDNRESILAGFEQLDYTGTGSDIPAAMERAVFELKNNGRVDADKFIIFLTGSTVDTGDAIRDIERTGWLQDTLAAEASIAGIRIFGVAFAGAADFQLVQALAQSTSGRYYQLQTAEELQDALSNVSTDMQQAVVAALPETTGVSEPAFVEIPATESVENIVVPAPEQGMGREERLRSIIIIAAAVVLTITLVALIVLLIKRSREYKKGMQDTASEAYLQDIKGYTGKPSYKLGKKATMLGRVAGKDSGHLDFIVIPESTIGAATQPSSTRTMLTG